MTIHPTMIVTDLSRLYVVVGYVVAFFLLTSCLRCIRQIQLPETTHPPPPRWRTETVHGGGCAICLEEYKDGENCAVAVTCNHKFHGVCIKAWLLKHDTCPLCRSLVWYGFSITWLEWRVVELKTDHEIDWISHSRKSFLRLNWKILVVKLIELILFIYYLLKFKQ